MHKQDSDLAEHYVKLVNLEHIFVHDKNLSAKHMQ
jgi:hypothetical protein